MLDELVIVSTQPDPAFLAEFSDPAVAKHVSPRWPNQFPITMATFDANLLCELKRWQLGQNAAVISAFFRAGPGQRPKDRG